MKKEEQLKKRNYANNRIKNMTDKHRERKKEYLKNYYTNRKNVWNHLINPVKELKYVYIGK